MQRHILVLVAGGLILLSSHTQTQETENKYKGLYFWVMLDTELRKLSIFFDTSSMPFLKKPICNIKAMKKLCVNKKNAITLT